MLKVLLICIISLTLPLCMAEAPLARYYIKRPVPKKATKPPEKIIEVEKVNGIIRFRLKRINRSFLLPEEVEQIKKDLNEMTAEELEILKKIIRNKYGEPESAEKPTILI